MSVSYNDNNTLVSTDTTGAMVVNLASILVNSIMILRCSPSRSIPDLDETNNAEYLIVLCIQLVDLRLVDSEINDDLSYDLDTILNAIFQYTYWARDSCFDTHIRPSDLGRMITNVLTQSVTSESSGKNHLNCISSCSAIRNHKLTTYDTEGIRKSIEEAKCVMNDEYVGLVTRLLVVLNPSPDSAIRLIRGNLTRFIANGLVRECFHSKGFAFAKSVCGRPKLLSQILNSIRYSPACLILAILMIILKNVTVWYIRNLANIYAG
jgi:hypothetical protein